MHKVTQDEVVLLLQQAGGPLSTNEIAKKLRVDWHTAKKRLNSLVKNGRVFEKDLNSNLTLYWNRPLFE